MKPHPRSKDPTGAVAPSATCRLVLREAMDRGRGEGRGTVRRKEQGGGDLGEAKPVEPKKKTSKKL